jgi:hypothetical protein
MIQGLVKVALGGIKNPSKSPFAKGDFEFSPLKKGGRGDFRTTRTCENQFTTVKLNLTLPWVMIAAN